MTDTSLTIIGGGVVGLAVAARLARRFPDLVVVERRDGVGQETSSRNSEVVHAGLYYPKGSWKARLCVRGNGLVRERALRRGVPFRLIGKLLVAGEEGEVASLEALFARATENGARVERLSAGQCHRLEPAVPAVAGFLSPDTGIVSAHGLMEDLAAEATAGGATVSNRSEVVGLERRTSDWRVVVRTASGVASHTSERVINAAGLDSDTVAALAGIDVDAARYRLHWWKGSYFAASPARSGLVSRLVYPVPDAVSLGTHAILGLDGRLRFGPDAEHLPQRRQDYGVDGAKRSAFGQAVGRLVPSLSAADLSPDLAGIRAKLQGPGEGFRDFVIADEASRGLPGLVSLVGIDSPGLTSALAIAEEVDRLVGG